MCDMSNEEMRESLTRIKELMKQKELMKDSLIKKIPRFEAFVEGRYHSCNDCKHQTGGGRWWSECGVEECAPYCMATEKKIDYSNTAVEQCSYYESNLIPLTDIKYVDATHLYNDLETDCYHFGGCNLKESEYCLNQCPTHKILQRIEQMRSLKVRENIHAKWITRRQQSYGYVCSRCLREAYDKGNFCSYCGAYMIEEKKEEDDLSNK